uniref:endo-1,3;1,4-beta-D-glucanase-like n=1 Tax=Erigeron canadensis TaxID=72917 RepID=UPI001CB8D7AD|nr:endo-1,3;1,4-beta-D-glucanase-like [Erigeron canadensis]
MSGPECCKNPPVVSSGDQCGQVEQIASLSSYVSGNSDLKTAVILVSDVYGYGAPKLRKFADKVASAGYYVVVPDLLHGDPATSETNLQDWVVNHRPEQTVEYVKPVIQALKKKGMSKIGAAGFCWGAKAVVELAKEADIIQVSALLHPSFVTLDDIKGVKVSIAILGGELDIYSPPALINEFEAALDAKPEVDHFVKIYPGMSHGWAIRYNDDDAAEVKCAEEACQDVVDWFSRYLKRNHSAL